MHLERHRHDRHHPAPQILAIRAATESIVVEDEALAKLGEIGDRASLRYAVQLLTPARIMASTQGRETISAADVDEIDKIFYDAKASARILAEQGDKYLQ